MIVFFVIGILLAGSLAYGAYYLLQTQGVGRAADAG